LRCARADIPRIREILKAAYGNCPSRAAGEIAAKRWGIEANTIRRGLPSEAAKLRKKVRRPSYKKKL
jgi:hypothetical protein